MTIYADISRNSPENEQCNINKIPKMTIYSPPCPTGKIKEEMASTGNAEV